MPTTIVVFSGLPRQGYLYRLASPEPRQPSWIADQRLHYATVKHIYRPCFRTRQIPLSDPTAGSQRLQRAFSAAGNRHLVEGEVRRPSIASTEAIGLQYRAFAGVQRALWGRGVQGWVSSHGGQRAAHVVVQRSNTGRRRTARQQRSEGTWVGEAGEVVRHAPQSRHHRRPTPAMFKRPATQARRLSSTAL